jgi:hypothetical protein
MQFLQNGNCSVWIYVELNRIGFSTLCICAELMFTYQNSNIRPFHRHNPIKCNNWWTLAVALYMFKYLRFFWCNIHSPVLFVVSAHYWSMQWAHLDTPALDCVPQICLTSEQEACNWTITRMISVMSLFRNGVSVLRIYVSWSYCPFMNSGIILNVMILWQLCNYFSISTCTSIF